MDAPVVKALIFMKGYSERVPGKNLREFCGKPLFYWILETLGKSKYVSEIIINTDSEEIAELAKKDFDVTIHMRPDYLLTINSNEANQIIEHDLSLADGDLFIQTHSTNPILKSETIDSAIEAFIEDKDHDSLMSVTPLKKRFYTVGGKPINHDPQNMIKTQELDPIYEENSCVYLFSKEQFNKSKSRIGSNPLLHPIDAVEAVDIDEESDFTIAESIQKYLLEKR